jgi:hypothetical protein
MQVRERPEGEPRVVDRAYYCPACAYALTVDVTLAGRPMVRSPELRA